VDGNYLGSNVLVVGNFKVVQPEGDITSVQGLRNSEDDGR